MTRTSVVVSACVGVLLLATSAHAHLGQPENYRWVEPPPELAEANQPPTSRHAELLRAPGPTSIWTEDLQAFLVVPETAFSGTPSVWIEIDPIGPSTLPPLPAGQSSTGNAYRIGIFDEDGGKPLSARSTGVELVLSVPHEPTAILRLEAGRWVDGPAEPTLPQGFKTPLATAGVYLAATEHRASNRFGWWVVVGSTTMLLGALGVLVTRRQRVESSLRS